jgi:O-antigen ligase
MERNQTLIASRIPKMTLPVKVFPQERYLPEIIKSGMSDLTLLGFCFLLIFIPFNEGGGNSLALFITQTLVLFLITLQVIRDSGFRIFCYPVDIKNPEQPIRNPGPRTVYRILILLTLWSLSSLFITKYLYATLQEIVKLLSYLGVFILGRELCYHKRYPDILRLALLTGIFIQTILALYHRYLTPSGQFLSGFININDFATFLVIGFVLLASRITLSLVGLGYLTGAVLLGWMTLATHSRGGAISLIMATLALLYCNLRKTFYGVLIVLLLFFLIPNPWPTQLLQWKQEDPFAYDRIQIWKSSLAMIRDHPLGGVGLGTYGEYFEQYRFPTENWIARYSKTTDLAHNEFLQVGAELGIPGFILAIALVVWIFRYGLQQRTSSKTKESLLIALLAVLVQSFVNSVFHSPAISITTVVLTVLLLHEPDDRNTFVSGNVERENNFPRSCASPSLRFRIFASLLSVYFWTVVILYPFLGHFYYLKAQELLDRGKPLEAIEKLNRALAYVPIHPSYHDLLGTLYTTAFKNHPNWEAFYGGVKEFSEAIRWNSREAQFYYHRAALYVELARRLLPTEQTLLKGITDYHQAIGLSPFDPFLRYNLAYLYVKIKQYSEAQEQLKKALDLEPNFIGGYYLLSKVLSALGEEEASVQKIEIARSLARRFNPESYNSLYLRNLFQRPEE